jgi:predicted flavoprotein YhiN
MAAREVPGLYFIGEVMDVTGWLGGFNFQWCWSSGGWPANMPDHSAAEVSRALE